MPVSDRVRIGDRERADAAERLSAHHAAGRLTLDELETRIERATAAVVLLALLLWCAAARRHPTRRSHA